MEARVSETRGCLKALGTFLQEEQAVGDDIWSDGSRYMTNSVKRWAAEQGALHAPTLPYMTVGDANLYW